IMFHLKKSGKAAQVGLSNFHLENLKLLGDDLSVFSVNQVPYSLLKRRYEGATREYCQKAGIPYMAFSPLAVGLLAGPPGPEALNYPARRHNALFQEPMFTEALKVLEEVQQVARDIDRKPVEVALAWVLAQDNILSAVVGSRKTKQVREFAGAGDLTLTESQRQRLTQASDAFHKNCALVV
ncbi:MAG: aldo/keto reductase, partial [Nitrospinaceae bacterium]|nr:aldo/keto reductase [Nitrospinaceae bacterium]NIR55762.1 aldo/keto reductase [Nitrospinaceae bacterium]NIS86210.1 aldo/keto reductase [Nitrospinaceae bacterium]NIT83045.1 aldo/keto reductase [Nitrospinaceae bacterium]NIU45255.1 aldo/keto reductase [Nitrospinaceae bacterium]